MNILHFSTGDNHGAYFGAFRTHQNLKRFGHNSKMCVIEKRSDDPDVIDVSSTFGNVAVIANKITRRLIVSTNKSIDHSYRLYTTTFNLHKIKALYKEKPDLIIIYYVAGFLSDSDIDSLRKYYGCPVALYLMDTGMLTGGCHYPWDCTGYQNECNACPALKKLISTSLPHYVLKKRSEVYQREEYFYLSASEWLDDKCKKSRIKTKMGIKKALLGIDENIFLPRDKVEAKKKLNIDIPDQQRIILVGAQSLADSRKGCSYLIGALIKIKDTLPKLLNNFTLLSVGKGLDNNLLSGISHFNIDFISDKNLYPYLYNVADVFICPSVEDAGPMMINEAIISGLPVVAFKMGVAEDLIYDGETGFKAQEISIDALVTEIVKALQVSDQEMGRMKSNARKIGLEKTSSESQVEAIRDIVQCL